MGKRPGIWAESRPEVIEGEFKHPWGTADKLYKGEAIDSFGNRYLLGVFETQDEAAKAFDAWNKEYEEAGAQVQENLRRGPKVVCFGLLAAFGEVAIFQVFKGFSNVFAWFLGHFWML